LDAGPEHDLVDVHIGRLLDRITIARATELAGIAFL
jgi:hypothetical protein